MPVSDEFVAELNEAIESRVDEKKNLEPDSDIVNLTKPVEKPAAEEPAEEKPIEDQEKPAEEKPVEEKLVQPTISDAVLTEAIRAGLTIEEAREFGSDKLLMRAIDMVRAVAVKSITEPKAEAKDPLAGFPVLDPEQFEPEVIKAFDALKGIVKQQYDSIQALQSQREQSSQVSQADTAREIEGWFDGQVEKLGEDFKESLGKGAYSAMDKSSAQFVKRDELAGQMAILATGYKASGKPMPPREKIFEQAAKMVLSDEYQKNYEKKLSADLGKREKQHINRPGGQKLKTQKEPIDEVVDKVNEFIGSKR
jgi:hypothetical protein